MIKAENGTIELTGVDVVLASEYSQITKELVRAGISKDMLEHAFRVGFMSREELEAEIEEGKVRLAEKFGISRGDIEDLIGAVKGKTFGGS